MSISDWSSDVCSSELYEDPNAPSPVSANYVQESSSPVDKSKSFLGGKHHPWRRLFARTVDICTAGFVLFLLLIFAFSAAMPVQAAGFAKAVENPIVASIVLYLVWLPAEALLLSLFGTTPAKRSEEHTSELQSLMRISYAVFCLKKKNHNIVYYK